MNDMMHVTVKTFQSSKYNRQHILMNVSYIEFIYDMMHVKVRTFQSSKYNSRHISI